MIISTKITNWLKRNFWDVFFVSIFIFLGLFVSFKNYVPGTWLTGWDNLHPEFNFYLNIKRSLFAVWQEYQGLGLLGGMSHAADLPRQLFLWFVWLATGSSLQGQMFVRYLWTFLMLVSGPVGVYILLSKRLIASESRVLSSISGFVGGSFYIFNLASLQTFYTPFETFTSFYGLFPWLMYFAIGYLKTGKMSRLLAYFVFSGLAVCAFYVQTLFVVYFIFLVVLMLEATVKHFKTGVLKSIKLSIVTFFVNAFWLAPVLYFTLTNVGITTSSHINSITTPETQIMNQARGDVYDIALLKGYWFDYYDWDNQGKNDYLYRNWVDHLSEPYVNEVGLGLFLIAIAGVVLAIFKTKLPFRFSFLYLFGISYLMLAGDNPPTGEWYVLLTNKIPLLTQIFRNSFTKWGVAMSLVYAVGIGYFVYITSDLFRSKFKYLLSVFMSVIVFLASVFVVSPTLQGDLISRSMKVQIPQDYFELFNYLHKQDTGKRIANFPMLSFWGWDFYRWGYRGSGFLWYGIEQPILDRAFDVWSGYNEDFYKEMSYSIPYGTVSDVKKVLEKYQINYILFDESIYDPGNSRSDSILQKQKSILENSGYISKDKTFGKLTLYNVNLQAQNTAFISAPFVVDNVRSLASVKSDELSLPQNEPEIRENFLVSQGYATAKNCELNGKGIVKKERTNFGVTYTALDNGVSCDYFYYPTIDYSKTYIMRIVGKNNTGRSLKFYLYNVRSENIDKQELLPTGDFDNLYLILPTGNGKDEGYTLNVETRSFGKISSENKITSIEFYPVNTDYLNNLTQGPSFLATNSNDLRVKSVQKYGTWLYKVDVQNWGLIQLGQGYDKGWEAFVITNYQLPIINRKVELPDFSKRLEHIKVSGWSNGWLVDAQNCQNENSVNTANCQLIIVFWPQLLEWGGGLLVVASFVILVLKKRTV